jgi:hypothetical protein
VCSGAASMTVAPAPGGGFRSQVPTGVVDQLPGTFVSIPQARIAAAASFDRKVA